MDKIETINKYELVFILDALMPSEEKDGLCKEVAESITKLGGKVINSQVWLDKQKFTFEIKKKKEGTYYLVNFEMPTEAVTKLRQALKLKEKILRFEVIKIGQ